MGIVLSVLFVIALLKDYRTTFVIFMAFSIWIRHFNFEMPVNFSFFSTLSIISLLLFLIKRKRFSFAVYFRYPLLIPSLLICLSYILSEIYALDEHHYPTLFVSFFPYLINVFIFWCLFQDYPSKVIKIFWNASIVFAAIISFYAIFEQLTSKNPFVELMIDLKIYTYDNVITDERFGIHRSQSIFSMHTTNGVACTLLAMTILWLKRKYSLFKVYIPLIYCLIVLLVVTNFMTGARSTIIGMAICFLSLINFNRKNIVKILTSLLLITIIYIIADNYFMQVVDSVSNTSNVSGSNTEMRSNQFLTSYYYMSKSPLVGNGNGYIWRFVQAYYREDILGAESIWFPEMVDRGILGCIALLIYIITCCYFAWVYCGKAIVFFVLGITIMNTLSSLPNFYFTYIFVYLLVFSNIRKEYEIESKIIQKLHRI